MAPPVAAAALAALDAMQREPGARRHAAGARRALPRGSRAPRASTPAARRASRSCPRSPAARFAAARLSAEALFERGINVQPIVYPAVPENSARLRFFVTCHAHRGAAALHGRRARRRLAQALSGRPAAARRRLHPRRPERRAGAARGCSRHRRSRLCGAGALHAGRCGRPRASPAPRWATCARSGLAYAHYLWCATSLADLLLRGTSARAGARIALARGIPLLATPRVNDADGARLHRRGATPDLIVTAFFNQHIDAEAAALAAPGRRQHPSRRRCRTFAASIRCSSRACAARRARRDRASHRARVRYRRPARREETDRGGARQRLRRHGARSTTAGRCSSPAAPASLAADPRGTPQAGGRLLRLLAHARPGRRLPALRRAARARPRPVAPRAPGTGRFRNRISALAATHAALSPTPRGP